MTETDTQAAESPVQAEWRPLDLLERRVAGVLVEKAKTTPSAYPLTLNAICTAANQKSNRDPVMQVEPDDVQEALERLRASGAVVEVQGDGRVPKYRHRLYEWLGVDKTELSVMAELLLRGPQTEGELRSRASRMNRIDDLPALRQLLESLEAKRLVVPLTPPGRGHMIAHGLYLPEELETVQSSYAGGAPSASARSPAASTPSMSTSSSSPLDDSLRGTVAELSAQLEALRGEMATLSERIERQDATIDDLRTALGR